MGRKHCGKRRNCSLRAISPFPPQCFQKACFPGVSNGVIVWEWVNPLPDDNILDRSKLKAFADDKSNVTQNIKVVFHRIENIEGKEENAGYQYFLLFPQCFQKAFSSSATKGVIVWEWVKHLGYREGRKVLLLQTVKLQL